MTHEQWVTALEESEYRESAIGRGLTGGGGMLIELYASVDGKTWTLTFSDTSGRTCGLAAGEDWQFIQTMGEPL